MRLSPWSGGSFAFLDGTTASPEPARFGPWRDDRRGVDDGYSGASLVTGLGLGLARALAAVDLPLPALAAALAVVAGLAGLEGVDLAAVDLVDDGGHGSQKFFTLWACRTIKLVRNLESDSDRADVRFFYVLKSLFLPGIKHADPNAFLLYEN